MDDVGVIGSPSTTVKVTVDILEDATRSPLQGQLVALTHPLEERCLIAIGTVTDIRTSNRWHEDPNMRGVLKRHGTLPHLSGEGDVRTAEVLVQAAYLADGPNPEHGEAPIESGASLSMSPTTGARVSRVTNQFLESLLRRHEDEIIHLGNIYRSEGVKLPMTIRHFGPAQEGGAGEAYHAGIFGMTGSGKTVFASYLLAAQLRHPSLAVLIMDPQGQFTSEEGLTFSLQEWAEAAGRDVQTYSISSDLRLDQDAGLLGDLLGLTRLFRDVLGVRGGENRESLVEEFTNTLRNFQRWSDHQAEEVLRQVLTDLAGNQAALQRVYSSPQYQARLQGRITDMLNDNNEFGIALDLFQPLHSLFTETNLAGRPRHSLFGILQHLLEPQAAIRPFVVIDFSSAGGTVHELLDSTRVKARILRLVCSRLNRRAEELFQEGRSLNTLVVFDEAQRFASEAPEDDESKELAEKLVDYVRTTRKYGLGWMFITQEIGSLRRGIYSQLRVRAVGYGLTSGTELQRLRETIGDPAALDLYRSFVDPAAIRPAEYPFMVTGPVSPLSFTGAPVFLSVYTDFDQFRADNNL